MVVASIALLVALGGTSIAAVTATLPKASVGTAQLKSNAVTTSKLKVNAVTSDKIKNGQVKPADLSASAKTSGPQGPPGPQGPQGIQGQPGPAGVAAPGYVAQVTSQTGASATTTNSTAFVNLAGATESITVPTGETARIYAVFSSESQCSGGGGWCIVRITVDGTELNPVVGTDFAYDSVGDPWESHAVARSSETLAAGAHTVQVQVATTSAATTLRTDDWALVIWRTKVS
jgi:hypothetical protein